jgi:hypothetical protein
LGSSGIGVLPVFIITIGRFVATRFVSLEKTATELKKNTKNNIFVLLNIVERLEK